MRIFQFFFAFLVFIIACDTDDETVEPSSPTIVGLIQKTIVFEGEERGYLLYVPEDYSRNTLTTLLLSFHGRGGNMQSQYNKTEFDEIADTAGFILITPQASKINGENRWNATNLTDGLPNDVGFIDAILEETLNTYAVNTDRIYTTGASNGGYFSFQLGCQLNHRIAAIASVIGAMNTNQFDHCQPDRPIPVLQIHGTEDQIVTYDKAEAAVNFWITHNQTSIDPIITDIPDLTPNDGSTVEHFLFENGQKESVVEHFKITGGAHDWPGHAGNMDINASIEAWKFVSKFDINGRIR